MHLNSSHNFFLNKTKILIFIIIFISVVRPRNFRTQLFKKNTNSNLLKKLNKSNLNLPSSGLQLLTKNKILKSLEYFCHNAVSKFSLSISANLCGALQEDGFCANTTIKSGLPCRQFAKFANCLRQTASFSFVQESKVSIISLSNNFCQNFSYPEILLVRMLVSQRYNIECRCSRGY